MKKFLLLGLLALAGCTIEACPEKNSNYLKDRCREHDYETVGPDAQTLQCRVLVCGSAGITAAAILWCKK